MISVRIGIKLDPGATMPTYANYGDAGADIYAIQPVRVHANAIGVVPTGVYLEIPHGYVGLIHPRSGLARKNAITVLNAPGTIDSGYRGEVKVLLFNHGLKEYNIDAGERIAQIVFQEVLTADFVTNLEGQLSTSERGDGGFGSTGN